MGLLYLAIPLNTAVHSSELLVIHGLLCIRFYSVLAHMKFEVLFYVQRVGHHFQYYLRLYK